MTRQADGSGLAGGLIAAALLDTLVSKRILTNAEASDILTRTINALDIKTPEGAAAEQAIAGLLAGPYAERR